MLSGVRSQPGRSKSLKLNGGVFVVSESVGGRCVVLRSSDEVSVRLALKVLLNVLRVSKLPLADKTRVVYAFCCEVKERSRRPND